MANIEKTSLLEMVYPVGSIYMSVNATSPSALFGGTWVKIEGRFLLGATNAYTQLANENGSFTLTETTMVRYGLDGYSWIEKVLDAGTYEASNAFFGGDPAPGLGKVCQKITSNVETIGGEAQHVLTVNEMPSHQHDYKLFTGGLGTGGYDAAQGKFAAAQFASNAAESNEKNDGKSFTAGSNSRENHLLATGGSQAHNNMPPYLTVNIWKRTA